MQTQVPDEEGCAECGGGSTTGILIMCDGCAFNTVPNKMHSTCNMHNLMGQISSCTLRSVKYVDTQYHAS